MERGYARSRARSDAAREALEPLAPGERPTAVTVAAIVAAIYMWRCAYWAVLGFQALLGFSIVAASLALLVASNVEAVIRSVVVIGAAGTLFWFLIRAMARLQMPTRTR